MKIMLQYWISFFYGKVIFRFILRECDNLFLGEEFAHGPL